MIALLQRVNEANVRVDGECIGEISRGLLAFIAVHRDDQRPAVSRLAERILGYRLFPDSKGRMNRSILEISGELLLVPQFTLTADTGKGTRASFTKGAAPEKASDFFAGLVEACREQPIRVETGRFAADMQVTLVNDGPVTFWLET